MSVDGLDQRRAGKLFSSGKHCSAAAGKAAGKTRDTAEDTGMQEKTRPQGAQSRHARRWLKTGLALALCWTSWQAQAALLEGKVLRTSDGDTVMLEDRTGHRHRIRLSGIDAPERRQAFGRRSAQHLRALVEHKEVRVYWKKHDRYGRLIGRIEVNGHDAGLEQLRAGLAWHYKAYASEQPPLESARYQRAEQEARHERRGLWQDAAPVPPWEERRRYQPGRTTSWH